MGPTASGKSQVAITLAEQFDLEVVNVDSASIYRHMDVGTAKPDLETRRRIPHHLLDLVNPTEAYSAARFREDALRAITEITQRGHIPLLVGGTMLYFKALQSGLNDLPGANPALRATLDEQAQKEGWTALHARLRQLDPFTATRLKPGDTQRIQRALEVVLTTGRPLSELLSESTRQPLLAQVCSVGLWPSERSLLHARIAQRFDQMLQDGLEQELRDLRQRFHLHQDLPAMRAVGYRQMWQYLQGELDWQQMRERGIIATRQLAKRQMTWMRSWPDLIRLDCLDPSLSGQVQQLVKSFIHPYGSGA